MVISDVEFDKSWCASENVVTRKIADETILVPISGNLANMQRIFTANEVGAFIWAMMDGQNTVKEIRQALLDEYDVDENQLENDLLGFIEQLKHSGLILEPAL